MPVNNPFQPAVKEQLKARIALAGPSGSGKTYTALRFAQALAKGGKIAVIDTERRSASLYADIFKFDALDFQPPYVPQRLIDNLRAAEANGYAVCIIDSGTHFWSGPGGILEIVDKNAKGGNSWSGWAVGTPIQQAMIDTLISVDMHVIMCMRSKQEWALQETANGKKEPVRLGMAPQQRGDIEYEFTVFGELDLDHRLTVSKTRCPALAGLVDVNPGEQFAGVLLDWLDDGADPDEKYREAGWEGGRDEHDPALQALLTRARSLTPDAQQAFREARSLRRLPSMSQSSFLTHDEADTISGLLDTYDGHTPTPVEAQEPRKPAERTDTAVEPETAPDGGAGGQSAESDATADGYVPQDDPVYVVAVEKWVAALDTVKVNAQLLARSIVPEKKTPTGMRHALINAIIAAGEVPEGMVLAPTQ